MTEKTPRERLEEERAKPMSQVDGPVDHAPDPRPMHQDQDLARRLSFVLHREGTDTGRDSIMIRETFTGPDEPRRFEVVAKDHDHGGEYGLSPCLTAAGLSAWINGLETGYLNQPTEVTD